jgi:hypothetical protein
MADPAYIVDGVLTDGEAWVALNSTTVSGSAVASIAFDSNYDNSATLVYGINNWSQYMDLVLVIYARGAASATTEDLGLRLNDDTAASNYSMQLLSGDGSAASASASDSTILGVMTADSGGANIFSTFVVTLTDAMSGKYTTCITRAAQDADGSGTVGLRVTTWKKQEAVNSIRLGGSTLGFAVGTRIDLFGILPRMGPPSVTVSP